MRCMCCRYGVCKLFGAIKYISYCNDFWTRVCDLCSGGDGRDFGIRLLRLPKRKKIKYKSEQHNNYGDIWDGRRFNRLASSLCYD